ncbi:MAG: DUF134 domain-containing protein [Sphaerochaetaceae bacterium]|nr:DUF134 domain-containing protein [Sphaerochaetaceae bacterium]MDC7249398.1 DUF134 domain-containing protein [Sphaerochaetaceae bacterium]
MPRNKKFRRIGYLSSLKHFVPVQNHNIINNNCEPVILSNEEFETIRLIDYKGYTQVECSKSMNIARTTVQQLYTDARYKLSLLLLEGRHVFVEGGRVEVFDDESLEKEVGFDEQAMYRMRQRRHRNRQNRNNLN